jgi:hypothetical protein
MQPVPHQARRSDRSMQAGQFHRAGDPAWDCVFHARQCRTCPEARRTGLAHVTCCAAVFAAPAIPHPMSVLDRRCFTWTRLRSMDRPSVVACNALTLRESNARTPNPLFRVSPMAVNKKQPFRRKFDEKNARKAQCDASMSHKPAATSLSRRCVQRLRIGQPRFAMGTNGTFSGPM